MSFNARIMVVAGGGGGNDTYGFGGGSGGGGGGGYQTNASYSIDAGNITVTVGGGGSGADGGTDGQNSVFGSITANGGGMGGRFNSSAGNGGGCGGGSAWNNATRPSGSQGGNGGKGQQGSSYAAGGGGGAGPDNGADGASGNGGAGGGGKADSISGSSVTYAGGGGGGGGNSSGGTGGAGGGGDGGKPSVNPTSGAVNTGGGGGGAGNGGSISWTASGGAGGSGIVIMRYLTADAAGYTITGGSVTTDGNYTVRTFTASETLSITLPSSSTSPMWFTQPQTRYATFTPSSLGSLYKSATTWSGAHDATDADSLANTGAAFTLGVDRPIAEPQYTHIWRGFLNWNTAYLANANVISAKVRIYARSHTGTSGQTFKLYLSNAADTITTADFDACTATLASDSAPNNVNTWPTDQWVEFDLNAVGLAAINKSGLTKFVFREVSYDAANNPVDFNSSQNVTSECDASGFAPQLVVKFG